jgi:hypothetical protein
MNERDRILEAARALRGDLDQLGLRDHKRVDRLIAEHLAAANAGAPVEDDLLELLRADRRTRLYTQHFLEYGRPPSARDLARRGFSPLPGPPGPVPLRKWSCPERDFDWYQRVSNQKPPPCPTHALPLEPAD